VEFVSKKVKFKSTVNEFSKLSMKVITMYIQSYSALFYYYNYSNLEGLAQSSFALCLWPKLKTESFTNAFRNALVMPPLQIVSNFFNLCILDVKVIKLFFLRR
jgi:hypothetical protein